MALDRLSRSLHSDVCDSDGCNDVVVHSTISGGEGRREHATLNNSASKEVKNSISFVSFLRGSFVSFLRGVRRSFPTWYSVPVVG